MKFAALMVALAGIASGASAAVSFTGTAYTQNFDSLANSGTANTWTADTTLPGWYARRTLAAAGEWATYRADNTNTGAIYSFGAAASTERAFGSVSSGTPGTITFAVVLQNNTSGILNAFDLSFVGEQWRNGGNTAAQTLAFDYKTVATFVASEVDSAATGYTALPALNFVSPIVGATAAVLDGNLPANQANLSVTGTSVAWNPGEFLILRWTDINDGGNDHSLAIDNVTFNAIPTPGAMALLGLAGLVAGRRKR